MKTAVSASLLALAVMAACAPAPADSPEAIAELDTDTAAPEAPAVESPLDAAIASELRSPEEKARDQWRHPKETLEFLGVEPDDTVVEIWPGGGWYTNILAPWLASGGGKLVAVLFSPEGIDDAERVARIETNNAKFKSNYTDPAFGTIDYSGFSANSGPLTEPGTADAVLTFRNIHNWMASDFQADAVKAMYDALKSGGILGVVEHRGNPAIEQDPKAKNGYVNENYAIKLFTAAGFELVGKSEINANPKDTKDYEQGVWTLPPTYRLGATDRDKYAAIGESDRFTLKFRKPLQ
ncbi:MAG: class I SAM-dependent methyltransferase [Novosphingobium sp.]|nr:class I SAM-dependent methyltransferase [Novosphingobium sp.]